MKNMILSIALAAACVGGKGCEFPPVEMNPVQATSRFGIDYVFPLSAYYQKEMWPKALAETGAGWVNFANVSWAYLEPNAPDGDEHTYRWTALDTSVKLWQKYGFQIVLSLTLGNGWFAGPVKYEYPEDILEDLGAFWGWFAVQSLEGSDRLPAEKHLGSYRAWIAALVDRYDGDGENDMPGLKYPIRHLQIGNEYGNPIFWTGTWEDYLTLLAETRTAVAGTEAQIIPSGLRWNDLFHDDPNAEQFEERFQTFLASLPSDGYREIWNRVREFNEKTLLNPDAYDVVDFGGNGPFPTASAGHMAWIQGLLGAERPVWELEARSEPRLDYNPLLHFHSELQVPDGEEVLAKLESNDPAAVAWYRAEQSRMLVQTFVTRFAAGCEKVFMGMASDWDKTLGALAVTNPYVGILDNAGNAWPALYAFRLAVSYLDRFEKVEAILTEDPAVKLFRFTISDGRSPVWVAWLSEETVRSSSDPLPERDVRLPGIPSSAAARLTPTTGDTAEEIPLAADGNGVRLRLTPTPVFLE